MGFKTLKSLMTFEKKIRIVQENTRIVLYILCYQNILEIDTN